MRAQGTIEYLVILGVVVAISLSVVALMASSTAPVAGTSLAESKLYWETREVGLMAASADNQGDVAFVLSNNSGERIDIIGYGFGNEVLTIAEGQPTLAPGEEKAIFLPRATVCTGDLCSFDELVFFYETSNGLSKRVGGESLLVESDDDLGLVSFSGSALVCVDNSEVFACSLSGGGGTDTNAETACAAGEVLYGDGSCGAPLAAETTRTINFDNSMTADDIQAEIDAVGKYIPYGEEITFQFADGTYNLDHGLIWGGFYGGGTIYIFGDTSEGSSLYNTQGVILNSSTSGISISTSSVFFYVRNLKVQFNSTADSRGIIITRTNGVFIRYSSFVGNGTSAGRAIYLTGSSGVYVLGNYVSNCQFGIDLQAASHAFIRDNADTGTMPAYGLVSRGSTAHRNTAGVIDGSNSDDLEQYGGKVFVS